MCKNVKNVQTKNNVKCSMDHFNFEIINIVKNDSASCTVNSFIYLHFLFQGS